jgi:hypothetical protein
MAQDTLITVLRGKIPVELPFKALVGKYADRLLKAYGGNVTISDAKLTDKLTEDEYRELAYKYPYLAPIGNLAPEPPLLTVKAAESLGDGRVEVNTLGLGSTEQQIKNMQPIESNGIQVEYLAGGDFGKTEQVTEPAKRGRKPRQTEVISRDDDPSLEIAAFVVASSMMNDTE